MNEIIPAVTYDVVLALAVNAAPASGSPEAGDVQFVEPALRGL